MAKSKKNSCKNAHYIDHMRTGARRVGMKVKDTSGDTSKVIAGWISETGTV